MIRMLTIAALFVFAQSASVMAATCSGAYPAITGVSVKQLSSTGGLNQYQLTGTVVNQGTSGQSNNTLQSVDIYLVRDKLDAKSIPPLAAGQSATFTYVYQRSSDSGAGTTTLNFKVDVTNPSPPGSEQCAPSSFDVKF